MAADFSKPLHTQSSDDILQQLKDNIESLAKMNLGSVATAPVGSIAFVTDRFKRKKSDGTWEELPLSLNLDAISSTSIEAESIIVQDTLGGVSGGAASGNTVEISGGDITASGNINATNITTLQSDVATLKQNSAANLTLGTSAGADNNLNIVKSSGTVSINIPDASGDVRGVLTAANQTLGGVKTFASKKIQLGNSIIADDNWHLVGDGSFSILSGNHTSGTSRFSIDVSGNVGIGTISPEECLHVDGSALVKPTGYGGGLIIKSGSVDARYTASNYLAGAALIETLSNHPIIIRTDDEDRLIVSTTGNVGIGTTQPNSRLHVHDGDIRLSNSNGTSALVSKSTDRTTVSSNSTTNSLVIMDSGAVGIGTAYDPSTYGKLTLSNNTTANSTTNFLGLVNASQVDNARMRIVGYSSSGVAQSAIDFVQNSSTSLQSKISFSTHDGTTLSERVRIDQLGNVGIGTLTPTSKLDVSGSVSCSTISTTGNATVSGNLSVTNTTSLSSVSTTGNASVGAMLDVGGTLAVIGNATISTAGTLTTGQINTSNKSISCGAMTASGISTQASASDVKPLVIKGAASQTANLIEVQNSAGYLFARIDASGRVGIGSQGAGLVDCLSVHNNMSNATYAILATSGVAGDVGQGAILIVKKDNNTTSAQVLLRALTNAGATGQGQINANGPNSMAFGNYSDARLKENIVNLPPQLDSVLSLRPVEFDYKSGTGHQIGFIAQEVQAIYPDLVAADSEGFLTLTDLNKNDARMIKAFQEFHAKNILFQEEIAHLTQSQKQIVESLEERIKKLEYLLLSTQR